MGTGKKGMKGGQGARAIRRKALGIVRRGRLLPETYATWWAVDDAGGPGDKVVEVELRVKEVFYTVMSPNDPESRK